MQKLKPRKLIFADTVDKTRLYKEMARAGILVLMMASLGGLICYGPQAWAEVRVRVHFNFVLNASGNRPIGDINSDAEVNAQVDRANEILAEHTSELRIQNLGITNVSDISEHYNAYSHAVPSGSDRDALRNDAIADKDSYNWRDDAINIYITGASGSAISDFPPDNNIILVNQAIYDTTIAHELGHSLNLKHTHDSDGCADTMQDDDSWNRDDIAQNNFSCNYADCSSSQQDQIDLVWENLMSYHNGNSRHQLSPCQMNRESSTIYDDRAWLLSNEPVYVDSGYSGLNSGSFNNPYETVQQAIDSGLDNKVMVLQTGSYDRPSSTIDTNTRVVPRMGTATVEEMPPPYDLPSALEQSENEAVRKAVIKAQRKASENDVQGVIKALKEAEQHAEGREKLSIQKELAQRYMEIKQFDKSESYYRKIKQTTNQKGLRARADSMIRRVRSEVEKASRVRPGTGESKINIDTNNRVVPRMGMVTVEEMPPPYDLPSALEQSENEAVRKAVIKAQRKASENDVQGVIKALKEAEQHAEGREKLSIQKELAQRYMEIKQFDKSESYYRKIKQTTNQKGLREMADSMIQRVRSEAEKARRVGPGTGEAEINQD